ncbi:hypothetical protein B6I21_09620 [candidate division KSB1 bacterium 4572_119]|nr:MAG: hypothetical protein B6I21_09620 [candidate division KSB1 bacterium 4572_119]
MFVNNSGNKKSFVFGNIAHFLVVYEASIPNSKFPPQQGLDSFQLMKKGNQWLITSIVNEVSSPWNPLPKNLFE